MHSRWLKRSALAAAVVFPALLPRLAVAKSISFSCKLPILWGSVPCGSPEYSIPQGRTLSIHLIEVQEENQRVCVDFVVTTKGGTRLGSNTVCSGQNVIFWTNGEGHEVKVTIQASGNGKKGLYGTQVEGDVIIK